MRIFTRTVAATATRFTGVLLLSTLIGSGLAGAETFRHRGSTAVIQQGGASQSRVERQRGDQTIITRNGNSTDITVRREAHASPAGSRRRYPQTRDGDFFRRFFQWRFSGMDPDAQGADGASDGFKRRMHQRLRNYPRY